MDHRTWGQTRNCKGCRFWSELIAQAIPEHNHAIQALCLNSKSFKNGEYTFEQNTCSHWMSGHHGAIDTPGASDEIRELYAKED